MADIDSTIAVPEALSTPGLSFRRFRGESDYAPMADVFTRSWAGDGLSHVLTPEEAARHYSSVKNGDPYRDFLMVEIALDSQSQPQLVGYGRADWEEESSTDGSGTKRVHRFKLYLVPEWRGVGIERAMLLYYERHLGKIAASYDFAGGRYLQTFVSDRHVAMVETLEGEGYEAMRYEYEMVRPDLESIPDLPLPEGIEVRPVRPEHLRTIWEAEVEAFGDDWDHSEPVEGDYERWLNYPNFQPHLWQVAWDSQSNQVAGMIRNYISEEENQRYGRQQGYTEWISVRRPWRRRGLARALLARSLKMHKDLGMTQARLSVDSQNETGALQLYESMGFRVIVRTPTYRKQLA